MPWWTSIKEAWQSLAVLLLKKQCGQRNCGGGDFHNRVERIMKEHSYQRSFAETPFEMPAQLRK